MVSRIPPRFINNTARAWRMGVSLAALVTSAGLLLVLAVPLRINRIVLFAALLGPRNALTVLTCAGFVFAAATLPWRYGRPVIAPLTLGLLVLTVVNGSVVATRGFANPEPAPPREGQLRILSWNTNGDLVDPSVIAELAARLRANIVVLPDANIAWAAGLYADAFQEAKYPMRLVAAPGPSAQIAVYIAAPYTSHYSRVVTGPAPDKTLRITPNTADLPTIVALHAAQPTFHGTTQWNTDLNWVADQCRSDQVVAVGDFNATVDSFGTSALGGCKDVATARHAGSVGTWPTTAPTWLGMPIDHILATCRWQAQTFTVITGQDQSGARHRPIFTVFDPPNLDDEGESARQPTHRNTPRRAAQPVRRRAVPAGGGPHGRGDLREAFTRKSASPERQRSDADVPLAFWTATQQFHRHGSVPEGSAEARRVRLPWRPSSCRASVRAGPGGPGLSLAAAMAG